MSAVETLFTGLQIAQCICETERLPDLKRQHGKRLSLWFKCPACKATGLSSYSAAAAAKKWNAAMVPT